MCVLKAVFRSLEAVFYYLNHVLLSIYNKMEYAFYESWNEAELFVCWSLETQDGHTTSLAHPSLASREQV